VNTQDVLEPSSDGTIRSINAMSEAKEQYRKHSQNQKEYQAAEE
jgi:hypothetical protein